jgi:23S rRNA pseudouridine1911/1915/1917 synthase
MSPDYRVAPSGDAAIDTDGSDADTPWADEPERRESIVPDALHGARLDKAVVAFVPEFSRSHLQTLIEGGHVVVEGRALTTASRKVLAGAAHRRRAGADAAEPGLSGRSRCRWRSSFEDEHLLVIDKPAGLVVHPAAATGRAQC